jgi:hypothetical protein
MGLILLGKPYEVGKGGSGRGGFSNEEVNGIAKEKGRETLVEKAAKNQLKNSSIFN